MGERKQNINIKTQGNSVINIKYYESNKGNEDFQFILKLITNFIISICSGIIVLYIGHYFIK